MSFSDRRHACVLWPLVLGAGLGVLACARDAQDEGARVRGVSPGWGLTTEAVSGVIEGDHFVPVPTQHLGAGAPVTLESRFEVDLGAHRLEDVAWVDEHTLAIRVPAGLEPGWYPVTVHTPLGERVALSQAYYASDRPLASLRVQPRSGPARMWVGEEGRLTLTVDNPGGTRALGVRARLLAREPGAVVLRAEPGPRDLEPGAQAVFTWTLGASTPGTARFTLALEGQEERSGLALSTALPEEALQVEARARPTSDLTLESSTVIVGLPLTLFVHVTNPGTGRLRDVRAGPPLIEGGRVEWAPASEPARLDLEPGATGVLLWRGVARSAGPLNLKVQVGGVEALTGEALPVIESTPTSLNVLTRGRLVTQFDALPADVRVGTVFNVDILASNVGQSQLNTVQINRGQLAAPQAKTCKVSVFEEPASVATLPGGGRTLFRARLQALAPGECAFEVHTQALDAVDNRTVTSETVTSAAMTLSP